MTCALSSSVIDINVFNHEGSKSGRWPNQLSNFKDGKYDLLLLDIMMSKMNGFELCQQLQNIDDKVKVCFITAYEIYYRTLREMFPTMEVDCFIAKPIGRARVRVIQQSDNNRSLLDIE
jgi:two-component SAPR family response regulator